MTIRVEPAGVDPDWAALAQVAAGDSDAFTAIVERHQSRLIGLCYRFLGDREEALDSVQEVFLKAYRHAGRARPRGQLFTWLYRIAVNHCLNRLRRRRIVRFVGFASAGAGEDGMERGAAEPAVAGADALAELEARERWRATRAAIDALPESQRTVLLLARFEGLSYREIAAALGITEGAVESRLVRAMRRLTAAQEMMTPGVQPGRVEA